METPKEYYYTYYSYEEWGIGYFGSRGCKCLPEEDINYFGSFSDKNFNPTQKIILKDDYATREEAYADEIILQEYYKVVENPHFANRAYQTSTKFYVPTEQAKENGKVGGKIGGKICYELGLSIHSRTKEEIIEHGKIGGSISGKQTYERGIGIHALTSEKKAEFARKGHKTQKELGIGFWGLTLEQRQENARKGEQKRKENRVGFYSMTPEQIGENTRKVQSQRWMCLETGFISSPTGLTKYQRKRGIDTSKNNRRRIE